VPIEIGRTLTNLDKAGYNWLLIEISLLDAAYNATPATVQTAGSVTLAAS
jgi:hypothetical protein